MGCQMSIPQCVLFAESFQHLDAIQFEGFDRHPKVTTEAVQLVRQSWAKMLQPKPITNPVSPSPANSSATLSEQQHLTPNSSSDYHSVNKPLVTSSNKANGRKLMSSPHTLFYNHFYGFLGKHHPITETIFAGTGGIKSRADSLIRMISSAVTLATQPAQQSEGDSFRRCAAGHAVKGIDVTQFAPVIDALMYSLTEMLGEAFTPTI